MLDERKLQCIDLLMEKKYTQEQIATMCGVNRTTVWDWRKKDKEFIAELSKRQQDLLEFKVDVTQKMFTDGLKTAIDTLEQIMKKSKNDNARVSAANTWLDRGLGKIPSKVEVKDTTGEEDETGNIIDNLDNWDEENKE